MIPGFDASNAGRKITSGHENGFVLGIVRVCAFRSMYVLQYVIKRPNRPVAQDRQK